MQTHDSKRMRTSIKKKKGLYKTLITIISVKLLKVELHLEFPDFLVATGFEDVSD